MLPGADACGISAAIGRSLSVTQSKWQSGPRENGMTPETVTDAVSAVSVDALNSPFLVQVAVQLVPIVRGDVILCSGAARAVVSDVRCLVTVRVFVTLLMLAQAIACPFLHCGECQGACAFSCVETHQDDVECCATRERADHSATDHTTTDHIPETPDCPDEHGPMDCLCGGAIRAEHVECPDVIAGNLFLFMRDALHSGEYPPYSTESRYCTSAGSVHFPPLISGRRICALTQTYLI